MQFNLQITIDAYQDTTWDGKVPGYGYNMTIEGSHLEEPIEVVGIINSDHSLKTVRAADSRLLSSLTAEVRTAVQSSLEIASKPVVGVELVEAGECPECGYESADLNSEQSCPGCDQPAIVGADEKPDEKVVETNPGSTNWTDVGLP